mmetsp:Transcript_111104/g.298169  ORF Transcript_111104/g.298169 Transcript_111104/m.298169 type:complete len:338 (-) Transcript_111104:108-1121(-)
MGRKKTLTRGEGREVNGTEWNQRRAGARLAAAAAAARPRPCSSELRILALGANALEYRVGGGRRHDQQDGKALWPPPPRSPGPPLRRELDLDGAAYLAEHIQVPALSHEAERVEHAWGLVALASRSPQPALVDLAARRRKCTRLHPHGDALRPGLQEGRRRRARLDEPMLCGPPENLAPEAAPRCCRNDAALPHGRSQSSTCSKILLHLRRRHAGPHHRRLLGLPLLDADAMLPGRERRNHHHRPHGLQLVGREPPLRQAGGARRDHPRVGFLVGHDHESQAPLEAYLLGLLVVIHDALHELRPDGARHRLHLHRRLGLFLLGAPHEARAADVDPTP